MIKHISHILTAITIAVGITTSVSATICEAKTTSTEVGVSVPLGGASLVLNNYYDNLDAVQAIVGDVSGFTEVTQLLSEIAEVKAAKYLYDFIDDYQLEVLYRITEAEATDGTPTQKANVASCIINRVLCADFPDTIYDVVFQKTGSTYQFSPIGDKRYWSVTITDETIEAVNSVCREGAIHDALFFHSHYSKSTWFKNNLEYVMDDGIHYYYK